MAKNSSVRRRTKARRQEKNAAAAVSKEVDTAIASLSNVSTSSPMKRTISSLLVALIMIILLFLFSCGSNTMRQEEDVPSSSSSSSNDNDNEDDISSTMRSASRDTSTDRPNYQVLQVLPHEPTAFTQGLSYYKGHLYESTGYHGKSQVNERHTLHLVSKQPCGSLHMALF